MPRASTINPVLFSAASAVAVLLAMPVFAADAPQKIDLNVGGYLTAYGIAGEQNGALGANRREFDVIRVGRIFFNGEGKVADDLNVGAWLSLRTEPSNEQWDETYIYGQGNWGRIEVGDNFGPTYTMSVAAPALQAWYVDGNDPFFLPISGFALSNAANNGLITTPTSGGAAADSLLSIDTGTGFSVSGIAGNLAPTSYVNFARTGGLQGGKLTYITPRINGLQAGVAYQPDMARQGIFTAGYAVPKGLATSGMVGDNTLNQQSERIDSALNYDRNVGDWRILWGAGYTTAAAEKKMDTSGTENITNSILRTKDQQAVNTGLQLTYKNLTMGGAYYWDNNGYGFDNGNVSGLVTRVHNNNDTHAFSLGANYKIDAWTVGANYYDARTNIVTGSDIRNTSSNTLRRGTDQLQRWTLGANYDVAPGVQLIGLVQLVDWNSANAANRNSGHAVMLGTLVNF